MTPLDEMRLLALEQNSGDGFMMFDTVRDGQGNIVDFRWTYANEQAARIVGRPSDWFPGRLLLEEMPGNREDGLFDLYVEVVQTGQPRSRSSKAPVPPGPFVLPAAPSKRLTDGAFRPSISPFRDDPSTSRPGRAEAT